MSNNSYVLGRCGQCVHVLALEVKGIIPLFLFVGKEMASRKQLTNSPFVDFERDAAKMVSSVSFLSLQSLSFYLAQRCLLLPFATVLKSYIDICLQINKPLEQSVVMHILP